MNLLLSDASGAIGALLSQGKIGEER